jgi:LmbE family N-acetylglucosaminyl deacetylase
LAVTASQNPLSDAPILLLAPHFDDAALSCSALLEGRAPIEIVTVFAGTPESPVRGYWDELSGFTDSTEGIETRRAEDAAALAAGGHRLVYLPLLEDQYGGERGDEQRAEIEAAIAAWAAEHPAGLVALPAGAGWRTARLVRALLRRLGRGRVPPHPDHLFVRDAALTSLEDATWTPLLYEEQPYDRGGAAAGEAMRLAAHLGRRAVEIVVEVDRAAKARRIAHYASQVALISPPEGRLDDPSSLAATERYWLLER